ncbi:UNVERIFIED_CONTAM: hypothetical protein RMT77_004761 [Armadillidium vulgare]
MFRIAALGVLILSCCVIGAPDYGGGAGGGAGFIKVALSDSYGPPPDQYAAPSGRGYGEPEEVCYPKYVTKIMTKDIQETENHYGTLVVEIPTTSYAYITETLVAPKTIIQYSTMTAYAEPRILTETLILYDTKMVTVPVYMTESAYGYNTQQIYFTETEAVYATKTLTQSYPITQTITQTGYETKGFYVTQTKVQNSYVTVTVKNPYYVTKYATETTYAQNYYTVTETINEYITMTVYNTVPEYHTVTKCAPSTKMYGYGY